MDFAKLFGFKRNDKKTSAELGILFAAIEKLMDGKPIEEIKLVTGWAGLLGRVAYADMDLDKNELVRIKQILSETHGIGPGAADSVSQLFVDKRVELLSLEDHLYTRMINDVANKEQKVELLKTLYRVAAADDTIRETEDATIRNISRSLYFSHKEFIAVRLQFKDKLAVLQG